MPRVQSVEHFDTGAERWDRVYDAATVVGHGRRRRMARAVGLLGEPAGSVLDVATGPGRLLALLSERGWDATGVDASPRMAALARERACEATVVEGDAEGLPFADNSFDAVVVIALLQWADAEAVVREAARVLRPGGRAVLGVRARFAPARLWTRRVVWPVTDRVKQIVPLGHSFPVKEGPLSSWETPAGLASVGLVVEREERVGCAVLLDPFDRLFPRLGYRLAVWAERSPRLRRVFAMQRLFLARKVVS